MTRTLEIGDRVIFADSSGVDQNGLVVAIHDRVSNDGVWSTDIPSYHDAPDRNEDKDAYEDFISEPYRQYEEGPCINLVFVSDDPNRQDSNGRQIERASSVSHISDNCVHGYNWRWPDEEPNPVRQSHT